MKHPMKYILFAASLFFPISTIGAYACTCGVIKSPCEEYGSASAVFIGVVTGDSSINSQDGEYQFQKRSVSFAVEETFHGLHGTSAEVITSMEGGDCGVGFKRVVEWPDGKPVQNAGIEYLPVNVPAGYGAKSDQEGRFSFKVSDGLKIKIRARGEIEWGKYIYSDWVEASVMGEDVKVKIVLPGNQ